MRTSLTCLLCFEFNGCFETLAPCVCSYVRYLGGGLPGENPRVAKASAQSREHLVAVKQALRAVGFNKQVLTLSAYVGI